MSFSLRVKNEIASLNVESKEENIALLSAIFRGCGSINLLGNSKIGFRITTENEFVVTLIANLIDEYYGKDFNMMITKSTSFKKNPNYTLKIEDERLYDILTEIGILYTNSENMLDIDYTIKKDLIADENTKRMYVRGAFLASGSLNDPSKAYHLEFVSHSKEYSEQLKKLINSFGLKSKIITRKNTYIVYIKEGEQVVDILNIIGAHVSLMELENIRILKSVSNNTNRIVNCETANLDKIIDASVRQVQSIEIIQKKMGLKKLPQNLREIAILRVENRDLPLKELGELTNPPIGKSGVNHRLRKLEKIAKELSEGNDW